MPTFKNVVVEIETEVDFEVFCGECGAGLCNESTTEQRRISGYQSVTVNACPKCMARKDEEIAELSRKIEQLEDELSSLK